jgi:hypothetical protein
MMLKKVESAKEKKWKRMTGGMWEYRQEQNTICRNQREQKGRREGETPNQSGSGSAKSEKKKEGDTVY